MVMGKEHLKADAVFDQPNIEVEGGVIKNVVIVQEGLDKDYGFFTSEFLQSLVDQGNAQAKGVKSRFGHPNMCKTTFGSYVGRFKNFRIEDKKVIADLTLDPITKETEVEGRGISMYDYILKMAESNSDMFGNSIHFKSGVEYESKDIGGESIEVEVYKDLEAFIASDLVDSPAATTNLFKSSDDIGIKVGQFLDENPKVFELISKEPSMIGDFFKRYSKHKSSKTERMSILKSIKKSLGLTKDIDLTLATGDMVTVITDAEQPQEGDRVVDQDGNDVPDADHMVTGGDFDGYTITTVGGEITNVVEPEEEEPEETMDEATEAAVQKAVSKAIKEFEKSLNEKIDSRFKENEGALEIIAKGFKELKENHQTLAKSVKGADFTPPPSEKQEGEVSLKEKVEQARQARKEQNK